ncbi:hypothetical protein ACHAQE_010748 [Botrytis cinerea]
MVSRSKFASSVSNTVLEAYDKEARFIAFGREAGLMPPKTVKLQDVKILGTPGTVSASWLSADIGAAIFSIGAAMTFALIQTYIIDSYTLFAASAIDATAVLRSLTGSGFPLFAPAMYSKLGYGWGNSVLGFAVLAVGYAGALILWFFGHRLREASPYAGGGG